jgi:hypothetical protein
LRVPGINAVSQDAAGALVVDGLTVAAEVALSERGMRGKDSIAERRSLVPDAFERRTAVRAVVNRSLDTAGRPIWRPTGVSALGPYLVRRRDLTERRHTA